MAVRMDPQEHRQRLVAAAIRLSGMYDATDTISGALNCTAQRLELTPLSDISSQLRDHRYTAACTSAAFTLQGISSFMQMVQGLGSAHLRSKRELFHALVCSLLEATCVLALAVDDQAFAERRPHYMDGAADRFERLRGLLDVCASRINVLKDV